MTIQQKNSCFPRKAVITGMGIICSLGKNRKAVFENVREGKCGIDEVTFCDLEKLSTRMGAEVDRLPLDVPAEMVDKTAQLAWVAMQEAILDSALDVANLNSSQSALSFGTCNGNVLTLERIYEHELARRAESLGSVYRNNFVAIDFLNKQLNINGPKIIFVTACSASNNAIGYAYDLIMTNQADVVFVGGADSLSKTTFAGFNSLQALAERGCSPFSEQLGISLGEGAAFMVLESMERAQQRKARIHAEVCGYGFCADAYHATSPDITGDGALRSMRLAVECAHIDNEEIGFVCAHGTGTEANDEIESVAIKKLFGNHSDQLYVTSTKSMHGHTLGAAGIIQAVISIDCINHNLIPAIINFRAKRAGCHLNYVENKPVKKACNYFLSNSFAFGGNNVSVVFGKPRNGGRETSPFQFDKNKKIVVTGIGHCTPPHQNISSTNVRYYKEFTLANPEFRSFRKAPRGSQFAIHAIENALQNAEYRIRDGTKIGMIWGTAKGPLKVFEKYYEGILKVGVEFASALHFPHVVLNALAGQASIAFGIKGYSTTVAGQFSPFAALQYAADLIKQGKNDIFVVGGADEISKFDEEMMREEAFTGYCLCEGAAALIIESEDHARARNAKIYAEMDGFSMTSSSYEKNAFTNYKKCIENTLKAVKLEEKDIDLHFPCEFGFFPPRYENAMGFKSTDNTQRTVGTLESATAIMNTIAGLQALMGTGAENNVKNVLISGAAFNGVYYSFILKNI